MYILKSLNRQTRQASNRQLLVSTSIHCYALQFFPQWLWNVHDATLACSATPKICVSYRIAALPVSVVPSYVSVDANQRVAERWLVTAVEKQVRTADVGCLKAVEKVVRFRWLAFRVTVTALGSSIGKLCFHFSIGHFSTSCNGPINSSDQMIVFQLGHKFLPLYLMYVTQWKPKMPLYWIVSSMWNMSSQNLIVAYLISCSRNQLMPTSFRNWLAS